MVWGREKRPVKRSGGLSLQFLGHGHAGPDPQGAETALPPRLVSSGSQGMRVA